VRLRTAAAEDEPVLELTSMIDVVFLLLIFFMVTTTFLDPEREIDVKLPAAESGTEPQKPPEEVVLNVRADGTVLHEGDELSRDELLRLLRVAAQRDPATPVTIRGDRLAHHEAIVGVMDACGIAGLSNLAVGTSREER